VCYDVAVPIPLQQLIIRSCLPHVPSKSELVEAHVARFKLN